MRIFLFFIVLLFSSIVSAQKTDEHFIAVKTAGSKFQFINEQTGQPTDQLLWDEVDPFINGYARVYLNNKFSFVNNKGKLIYPVEFEDARNFLNNITAVKKDGKWGFINGSGKIIFPFTYDIVFDFEENVSTAFENKKWWLISINGEVIKSLDISVFFGFKNGVAKIIAHEKEALMNTSGEIIFNQPQPIKSKPISYHPNSNNTVTPCPDNINFENGNFTNWQCYLGSVDSVGNTNVITVNPSPPTANRHVIIPRVTPSAIDPFGLFPTNPPDGSNFAVKLGNTNVGAQAERIRYTIRVPVNDSNFSFKYDYAVVLQDPGHTPWTQPRFNAKLLDSATNTYIPCASFEYISTSGLPGFKVSTVNSSVIYKEWSSVFFSFRGYGGRTLYLEFTTADCVRRAHWGYAYVDVESNCGQAIEMQYDCTYPNITTLTGPPGFQTYNWWNQNYTTLLGTGQTITLNPGPVVNTIIWLEMIPFLNFGCKDTLMVKITGILNAQFDASDTVGCAPKTLTFYNRNLPSIITLWDFGDGSFGTGDTVTHTFLLPGTYTVSLNVTVPSGCNGTATHQVVINPTPNVVQPPNQTLCNGATTNAISFTGAVSGTAFNWTNNNTSIGLAASGTGNIAAFTAINTTNAAVIATIIVTPSASGCAGPPQTFTIKVNPTPNVVQPPNQILCNAARTNTINFTGSVSSTAFNWTNNNTSIGLAASGTGNIAAFTAINTTNTPVTATITVTPTASGCAGPPQTFNITVNPTPNVVQPPNQTLCNGATTNAIIFNGAVSGTVYNWTNTAASVGLPASGSGNIAPFTAYSNGYSTSVATIAVTPTANGCVGPVERFTITVNPTPNVVQPPNQTLCNGATANTITFTGAMNSANYSWTNNNTSIGLAANGSGNIAGFNAINTGNAAVTATITVTPATNLCTGTSKTFTITVNPAPLVTAGNDADVCLGNSIQLTATGASQYLWIPATRLSCTNCANPIATPVDSMRYIVKGTNSFSCVGYDTILLNVIRPFQMLISPNDTLCIGESAILRANGANNYLWSPPDGLNRVDIAAPTATPTVTTTYRVVGYDGHHCFTDTNFVKITVGPIPTLNIGPDLTLSTGTVVHFNPVFQNGPIINWSWAPATGLSCTNCPAPTFTVKDNTYYTLAVTNNYGCITNDTVFIFTFCKSAQVFIPNAFTPDGDGLNDILMVRGKGIFVKSFRIFNRWGELVFEKSNFNPNDLKYGWDGKVRGVPATPDVFVYTAEVICDNSIMYTYKGNTTILK